MFGNPAWFQKKTVGWGLCPVSWKGWLYAAVWVGVICLPFIALLACQLVIESLVWVVAMMGALVWDVHQVRRDLNRGETLRAGTERVRVIGDDTEPDLAHPAARSGDVRLRRG
ncbi:MAG: hypothetical protein GXY58_05315 [Planctomycetaceae bacterium]|nr:hypothetical protein [Planctomycetaceae bacterium]